MPRTVGSARNRRTSSSRGVGHVAFISPSASRIRALVLGEPYVLPDLFGTAGFHDVDVQTVTGTARFPSLEAWLHTEVKGWTLADVIDDAGYGRLLQEAPAELGRYVGKDGTVAFDLPANVVVAKVRAAA